ncbi:hypothetical protein [Nonomuraea dietziae]|uniref:hypothetical protein n=1 Tax=Nonomuraea dietziae TaxID=65515 RepID=UPI00344746A4
MDTVLILGVLAEQGVTAILKADGERMREGARPWTFVARGGLVSGRPVRIDDDSVDRCLEQALPRLTSDYKITIGGPPSMGSSFFLINLPEEVGLTGGVSKVDYLSDQLLKHPPAC